MYDTQSYNILNEFFIIDKLNVFNLIIFIIFDIFDNKIIISIYNLLYYMILLNKNLII